MTNLYTGFTTNEVIAITGVTNHSLKYWYDQKIILPSKLPLGTGKRNARLYSFSQILEMKAIKSLRSKVSVRTIKALQTFLHKHFDDKSIANKDLIAIETEGKCQIFWKEDQEWFVQLTGKNAGQVTHAELVIIPSLDRHLTEVIESVKAGDCETLDFDTFKQRIKGSKLLSLVA